jgi:hypothetical protein
MMLPSLFLLLDIAMIAEMGPGVKFDLVHATRRVKDARQDGASTFRRIAFRAEGRDGILPPGPAGGIR